MSLSGYQRKAAVLFIMSRMEGMMGKRVVET